jgi:periplasmic protein TonB
MMDPSSFGTVSFHTVAAGGPGELARVRASIAPAAAAGGTRSLPVAIFCASLVLHGALLVRLQAGQAERTHSTRKASQVEIQITRPPPPPPTPVVVPPQALQPPPPKLVAAPPRAQPRLSLPEPVHGPPAAAPESPGLDAPASDEGTSAAGTGDVAALAVQAAAPPPPPPPPPVIEAKEGANYLKNPRPAYPRLALREGWEGTVLLRVRVLPNGRPEAISIQRSSGRGVLDEAAVAAVHAWAFAPATQGGAPVAGWVNVPIEFRLQ